MPDTPAMQQVARGAWKSKAQLAQESIEAAEHMLSVPEPDLKAIGAMVKGERQRKAYMEAALEYMRNGKPLYAFAALPGAPSMAQLVRWFATDDAKEDYRLAEECCANVLHGEILHIAAAVTDPQRAKIMIEARTKLIERMHPKKFAKQEPGAAGPAVPALVVTVKQYTDTPPYLPLEEMLK